MRKLTVYAAAAVAMTGAMTMTSQAAIGAYVIGGNCGGGWDHGSSYNGCENGGSFISGGSCSVEQIVQMITSSDSGNNCAGGWGGNMIPVFPDCLGGNGNFSAPDLSGCQGNVNSGCGNWGNSGSDCGNWGNSNSDCGNWGTQNPDCGNSGCQIPGIPDWGVQKPGTGDGETQNPGTGGTGTQNPGTGGTGTEKPGTGGTGTQNPGTGGSGTANPGITDSERSYIQQVIDLVNEERAKAGLCPVTEAADVSAAADIRALEITRSFSHTRPDGTYYNTVLDQSGVSYRGSGENIAYGQQTPAAVMNGWMNSQSHRANILNGSYTKIGVGYYENGSGVKYWVQLFTY